MVSGMEALIGSMNSSMESIQENRIDVTVTDQTGQNIDRIMSHDMSSYTDTSGDVFFANTYHDTVYDRDHNISIAITEHFGNYQASQEVPRRTHFDRVNRLR